VRQEWREGGGTIEGAAGLDLRVLANVKNKIRPSYGKVECDFGGLLLDFGVEALFLIRAELVCQCCRGHMCGEDTQQAE